MKMENFLESSSRHSQSIRISKIIKKKFKKEQKSQNLLIELIKFKKNKLN